VAELENVTATRETQEERDTHVATLLVLGRIIVGIRRPVVGESWFVLLTGLAAGAHTVVRVDA